MADLVTDSRVYAILARSRVTDWDALRASACYRADECRLDGACPFLAGCKRAEAGKGG